MTEAPDIQHTTLVAAMIAAQKSFDIVRKNAKNPHFNQKYADLATVIDAVVPGLLANGVLMTQPVVRAEDGGLLLRTILHHGASGEQMISEVPLPAPADWQKWGSALTYARRYTLLALVGVAPEDDDGNQAEGIERRQVQAPKQRGEVSDNARKAELAAQAKIAGNSVDPAEARDRFLALVKDATDLAALSDLQIKLGKASKAMGSYYQECAIAVKDKKDAMMSAPAITDEMLDELEPEEWRNKEGRIEDDRQGELVP